MIKTPHQIKFEWSNRG